MHVVSDPHPQGYLRQKKNLLSSTSKESTESSTIRAYVGYEYECPRGHRFISSSPDSADKNFSANASPAEKLVGTDMPLYTLCPCRDRSVPLLIPNYFSGAADSWRQSSCADARKS